jgi:YbgC/YbaW family acyl-CoA thioester hydrolase
VFLSVFICVHQWLILENKPMPEVFRTKRRVEFADTDMAGIVHFANFFRYMESAEVEFLRAHGLTVKLGTEFGLISFPRVAAACDYVKPARFEDVLEISVRLERLGRKSATYVFEFTKDGELIAHGKVTSVCCRLLPDQQIEPIEIPPQVRKALEPQA